jgi:competence ComEA-like helix-hairpin-helix protein
MSEDFLLGEDTNFNGILDPEENDGSLSFPPDDQDGSLDGGWARWLTVHSAAANRDARGMERVNIAQAGEDELAQLDGISAQLASAIVAYRKKQNFENIGQLLDVVTVKEESSSPGSSPGAPGGGPGETKVSTPVPQDGGRAGASGEKLISESLFKRIADRITVTSDLTRRGVVHVNTASREVLCCLGAIDEEIADAIIAYRRQYGDFTSIGKLLDVPGVTTEVFQSACSRLTVRPGTYRILAEGYLPSTRARRRVEVVVRLTSYDVETLSYREES